MIFFINFINAKKTRQDMTKHLIYSILLSLIFFCINSKVLAEENPNYPNYQNIPDSSLKILNYCEESAWAMRFSDPVESFDRIIQGIEIADLYQLQSDRAKLFNYLGVIMFRFDYFDQAAESFRLAHDISLKYDIKRELAYSLQNFANMYYSHQMYDSATYNYSKALELFKQINDNKGTAYSYLLAGNVCAAQNRDDAALEYYKKCLNIRQKFSDEPFSIMVVTKSIVENYIKLKQEEQAKYYLDRLSQEAIFNNQIDILPYVNFLSAEYFNSLNQLDSAIFYLDKALTYQNISGTFELWHNVTKLQAQIYQQKGDYKNATLAFENCNNYLDSLNNDVRSISNETTHKKRTLSRKYNELISRNYRQDIQILNSNNSYYKGLIAFLIVIIVVLIVLMYQKSEILKIKKNKQINTQKDNLKNLTLNQQVEETQLKLETLAKQLDNNEKIQTKMHSFLLYDIKNPIGQIIDYCSKAKLANSQNEMQIEIDNIKNISSNLYLSFDNLMMQTRILADKITFKAEIINLHNLVQKTLSSFVGAAVNKYIELKNLIGEDLIIDADKLLISFVIKNLFSNAIKYAQPESEVLVKAEKRANEIEVMFIDNGPGFFENSTKSDIEINENFLEYNSSGLGLLVCKEIIELHQGKLYVKYLENNHTCVSFIIPSK